MTLPNQLNDSEATATCSNPYCRIEIPKSTTTYHWRWVSRTRYCNACGCFFIKHKRMRPPELIFFPDGTRKPVRTRSGSKKQASTKNTMPTTQLPVTHDVPVTPMTAVPMAANTVQPERVIPLAASTSQPAPLMPVQSDNVLMSANTCPTQDAIPTYNIPGMFMDTLAPLPNHGSIDDILTYHYSNASETADEILEKLFNFGE